MLLYDVPDVAQRHVTHHFVDALLYVSLLFLLDQLVYLFEKHVANRVFQ